MAQRSSLKTIANSGFAETQGGRLTNRDGTPNLRKTGIPWWERISPYHFLLQLSRWKFVGLIFCFYTVVNLLFATIYFLIGVDGLSGTEQATTRLAEYMEAFFFSAQTITTVGYGHTAPLTPVMSVVASFESFAGILAFALVTGLFYGRFSRPKAFVLFSNSMLLAPYKAGRALMIRVATYKNNNLTDAEAMLTAALTEDREGRVHTDFYPLKLEISRINSLAISWTIVHPIDEESPLYNCTEAQIRERRLELIVSIKAFDDHFSNTVQDRTSYTIHQLVYGAKFQPMFERPNQGDFTILRLEDIDLHKPAELPEADIVTKREETATLAGA